MGSMKKSLTRIFEYTANKLPIIALNNPTWIAFCEQFNAAIHLNPSSFNPSEVLEQIQNKSFYDIGDTTISLWKYESSKLTNLIEELILD